jgi:hypothetical protein
LFSRLQAVLKRYANVVCIRLAVAAHYIHRKAKSAIDRLLHICVSNSH